MSGPRKMKVDVTQEHIDTGFARMAKKEDIHDRACHCPLALALFTKEKCKWVVGIKDANPLGKNDEVWDLDEDAYDFVLAFDSHEDVKPCQVTLTRRVTNPPRTSTRKSGNSKSSTSAATSTKKGTRKKK